MSKEGAEHEASTRPPTLSTLEAKIEPGHTALLIVDMCNDFLDPDGKTAALANRPIGAARTVIPVQQRLCAAARAAGVRVIYLNHCTKTDGSSVSGPWLDARSRATYSVEDVCLEGSWGGRVIVELAPEPGDFVISKYRYSGFAGTHLDATLRANGIRTVVCAGVSTNVCVEATAREAFSLDYYVVIPSDACASWDTDLHEASLRTAAHRYAVVSPALALIECWGHHGP